MSEQEEVQRRLDALTGERAFELHLTEEQFNELSSLWHEYLMFGCIDRENWHPIDFIEWLDEDEHEYGVPEVEAFLREKERREGTALPEVQEHEHED